MIMMISYDDDDDDQVRERMLSSLRSYFYPLCVFKCATVQMFKCATVQMFKCATVQMFKCAGQKA